MAVIVSGEVRESNHPAVVLQSLFSNADSAGALREKGDKAKRQAALRQKATQAKVRAEDALDNMKRAKMSLEDLVTVAKMNPSYANVAAAKEAAGNYQNAAANYIGALFAMEFAEQAAEGAGIVIASKNAGQKISPSIASVRQDIQVVENNYKEVAKAQAAAASLVSVAEDLRLIETTLAKAELKICAERVAVLYDVAKMPSSTAEDGHSLIMALDAMKAQRKQAYVTERDAFIADMMGRGHSEQDARNKWARELKAKRRHEEKTGERREHFEHCNKCRRLGDGLIRGDVQQGRAIMPEAMEKHYRAKQDKKAARAERDVARREKDASALRESVDRYVNASVRMTMGIFKELTAEYMTEGYTKKEAKQLALEKFRAEHERRRNGTDRDAREWQQSHNDFRMDIGLLRLAAGKAESIYGPAKDGAHRHERHERDHPSTHRRRVQVGAVELANARAQMRVM